MKQPIVLSLNDKVSASNSQRARFDSDYLIQSNQQKCKSLLDKDELTKEDIIDILVSLHIVLEVGLSSMYRDITLLNIKKSADLLEIIKNIDQINFIDKTVLFIYNSKFNFDGELDKANRFHKIIGSMKDFSKIRNQLLHGHSITTLVEGGEIRQSALMQDLTKKVLVKQLDKFIFIISGMRFYIDCTDIGKLEKEHYFHYYINYSFLPAKYLKGVDA